MVPRRPWSWRGGAAGRQGRLRWIDDDGYQNRPLCWGLGEDRGMENTYWPSWPLALLAGRSCCWRAWDSEGLAVSVQCTSPSWRPRPSAPITISYQPGETRARPSRPRTRPPADCTGISRWACWTVTTTRGTTSLPTVADPLRYLIRLNPISASRWSSTRQGIPDSSLQCHDQWVCSAPGVGGLLECLPAGRINREQRARRPKLLRGHGHPDLPAAPSPTSSCAVPGTPDTSPVNAFQHPGDEHQRRLDADSASFPPAPASPSIRRRGAECLRRGEIPRGI